MQNKIKHAFIIGVRIGFYREPYETFEVMAYDKNEALSKVYCSLPKGTGYRFLSVINKG